MKANELEAALTEHDALVVRCVHGEIAFDAFLRTYDGFYQRWALDGHEGDAAVLARFEPRIAVHRRIWEEVETRLTTADHGRQHGHLGFIGPEEAMRRLAAIARDGRLTASGDHGRPTMPLTERDGYRYGRSQADIREELLRYSAANGFTAQHFADAACFCGSRTFRLQLDDEAGAAVRLCVDCSHRHAMGDSADFLQEAELGECACPCGAETFEISVGVSLYPDSDDVRWLYLGCRCSRCGLIAVYGDWKCEFLGHRDLLALI